MSEIQSKLKDYRQKLDVTQEDLAQRLGVTRQTIIALEQAKYQPSLELAWRCSKLFGVPIEDVFSFIN